MRRVFRLRSARRQVHGWLPVGRPSQLSSPVALAVALILLQTGTPESVADPCPDVEVMFARGTFEPAGVGAAGETFIDSLRAKVGTKSVGVYPVDYPASLDFARAADGVIDASHRVEDLARRCPKTKVILGGYSQGAAVIAYITTDMVPPGYSMPDGITGPMPAEVAEHVAAVALFGKPSNSFLNFIDRNAPPIKIGHLYQRKTIDLCVAEDPVCSATGNDNGAHRLYAVNGMTDQAADYAAQRLSDSHA